MKTNNKRRVLTAALATAFLMSNAPVFAAGEKVAVSFQTLSIPFFIFMHEQAVQEAKALDIELLVQDAQASSSKQSSDIENSLTQGVAAVVLTPNDVMVLITGQIGSTTAMDRAKGVHQSLSAAGGKFKLVKSPKPKAGIIER